MYFSVLFVSTLAQRSAEKTTTLMVSFVSKCFPYKDQIVKLVLYSVQTDACRFLAVPPTRLPIPTAIAKMCNFASPCRLQQFRAKSRAPCVDSLSQFSMESTTSLDSREPQFIAAGDIRKRLSDTVAMPKKTFNVSADLPGRLSPFFCMSVMCLYYCIHKYVLHTEYI